MKRVWMTAAAAVLALSMLAGCSGVDYPSSSSPSSRPNGTGSSTTTGQNPGNGNSGGSNSSSSSSSSSSSTSNSSSSSSSSSTSNVSSSSSSTSDSQPDNYNPWRIVQSGCYTDLVKLTGYEGKNGETLSGDVVIPREVNGIEVTLISSTLFAGNDEITSVTIPGSMWQIDKDTFANCKNLKSVTIQKGRTSSIFAKAFMNCKSLERIELATIWFIGESAFENDTSLTEVTIPGSNVIVDNRAFAMCENLKSIAIPDVMLLKENAFVGCKSLKTVNLSSKSQFHIESRAFNGCMSLEQIVIPESTGGYETGLEQGAFHDCPRLKKIYLPKTLTKIDTPFTGSTSVDCIYYAGTKEDWDKVEKSGIPSSTKILYEQKPENINNG